MAKTGIEYLTKSWNFYTGCNHWKELNICPVGPECWAKGNYHRYGRGYEPQLHPEKLLEPLSWRKPQRVGVCFTGDLMGDWVHPWGLIQRSQMTRWVFGVKHAIEVAEAVKHIVNCCPQNQFFFLTKNPAGYAKWGSWPDNAWLGATVCNDVMLTHAMDGLMRADAANTWLSFEPVMEKVDCSAIVAAQYYRWVKWIVIGGWSTSAQRKRHPIKIEWIREIVEAADKAGVPVFLKPNLESLFVIKKSGDTIQFNDFTVKNIDLLYPVLTDKPDRRHLRQELPGA